jgi:hypothetical protein
MWEVVVEVNGVGTLVTQVESGIVCCLLFVCLLFVICLFVVSLLFALTHHL